MSRHYYIVADTGGSRLVTVAELGNVFGGVISIIEVALRLQEDLPPQYKDFYEFDGKQCSEVYPYIRQAVIDMHLPENREKISENGFYTDERCTTARNFLVNMLYEMWLNPNGKLYFS